MARDDPKYIQDKELFHVKLLALLKKLGLDDTSLANRLPGVQRQSVNSWRLGVKTPDGIHMLWLLQLLDVTPTELIGTLDAPEGANSGQHQGQERRTEAEGVDDDQRMLAFLETFVRQFREYIEGNERARRASAGRTSS